LAGVAVIACSREPAPSSAIARVGETRPLTPIASAEQAAVDPSSPSPLAHDAESAVAARDAGHAAQGTATLGDGQGASPPVKDGRSCGGQLPPHDLWKDNVPTTEMSGLAEITSSKKTDVDGTSPPPATGYVTFHYEVRVVRWFAGNGKEHMVLRQNAEADFDPAPAGRFILFSACGAPDGAGYEPDVGYFFPIDTACRPEAEAMGEAAAKRVRGSKKQGASACTRGNP